MSSTYPKNIFFKHFFQTFAFKHTDTPEGSVPRSLVAAAVYCCVPLLLIDARREPLRGVYCHCYTSCFFYASWVLLRSLRVFRPSPKIASCIPPKPKNRFVYSAQAQKSLRKFRWKKSLRTFRWKKCLTTIARQSKTEVDIYIFFF